jgi:hypothetical protein
MVFIFELKIDRDGGHDGRAGPMKDGRSGRHRTTA